MVKIFCERLKELRLEKKLSAVKLGEALGVRDTTILRWESGAMSPSIDALLLICEFFGITPNYMLGLED